MPNFNKKAYLTLR